MVERLEERELLTAGVLDSTFNPGGSFPVPSGQRIDNFDRGGANADTAEAS